ncbi:unnamed protein product [Calypogeia fissa]
MDEGFMSRVAERVAAATEAVSSFSPTADPKNLAAVQTMDEWMAAHSPATRTRCADCKAPLVEGSTKICIACGSLLPSDVAVRREHVSFGTSLAKQLFYESVHLEDPHDTASDDIELEPQPTSSGTKTIANGYIQQQPPSSPRLGVETEGRNLQRRESINAIVGDAADTSIPPPARSLSSKSVKEEEEEEYIWESSEADDFGLQAWSQQLARGSGGDPKEVASADDSATLYSANQTFGQTSEDDFIATASISANQSRSASGETDFKFFFPSAANSVGQPGGEQLASTTGPSFPKESPGPRVGTDFHDSFQASFPTPGDQFLDPKVRTSDPFVPQASGGHTLGDNFDDFFQAAPKSTDGSHLHSEETAKSFSGEESSTHNIETGIDDFFQSFSKPADHSRGLDVNIPSPHTGEGTGSQKIETDFDGFFEAASGSDHSRGLNVETPTLQTTDESNGEDGEADFDDFLQAAPSSADQLGGSNEETSIPHVGKDLSGQRQETLFDFFSQTSTETSNQLHGSKVEAADDPFFPQKPSVANVETDFDFFFQSYPVSGDLSGNQNIRTEPPHLPEESFGQKIDYFDDFFQAGHKSGDQSNNIELLLPTTVQGENTNQRPPTDFDFFQAVPESASFPSALQVETPVKPTAEGSNGQDEEEVDFDDFFQAAHVPAGHSSGQNTDEATPNSAEGSSGENIETDFDDFFQAAPKLANGSGGHIGGTDFDYFFQTPQKSVGRLPGQHAQPGVPDDLAKSNGQIEEPDFNGFFQGADIPIKQFHGQKVVKTDTTNPAEESIDQNGKTGFPDFFQAAPYSVGESNGHTAVTNFDPLNDAPHPVKESPGQSVSLDFDGFFSTPSRSVDNGLGKSEAKDFDHFFQVSPWSTVESLDQNETEEFGDGDFDDFVQAAPQSADKVISSSHITEYDFFQETPGSVHNSQQDSADFDDFLQAAPQTTDKSSMVETRRQIDFMTASDHLDDESRSKQGSTGLANLFDVAPSRTEDPKPPSSSSFLVNGNGSGQAPQAGASSTSTLTQGKSSNGSSNGDVLKQFEGLHISPTSLAADLEPSRKMPDELSDLSFRLTDHLVISGDSPSNMWSFN